MNTTKFKGYRPTPEATEPKTYIRIDKEAKEISLSDNTDQYNLPAGYNRGVQGIKKAFEYIEANREELQTMTMYRVIEKLEEIAPKLKFHTYCRMD